MALRLIYQMFSKLLGWIVLHTRSDAEPPLPLDRVAPRQSGSAGDPALVAGGQVTASHPDHSVRAAHAGECDDRESVPAGRSAL